MGDGFGATLAGIHFFLHNSIHIGWLRQRLWGHVVILCCVVTTGWTTDNGLCTRDCNPARLIVIIRWIFVVGEMKGFDGTSTVALIGWSHFCWYGWCCRRRCHGHDTRMCHHYRGADCYATTRTIHVMIVFLFTFFFITDICRPHIIILKDVIRCAAVGSISIFRKWIVHVDRDTTQTGSRRLCRAFQIDQRAFDWFFHGSRWRHFEFVLAGVFDAAVDLVVQIRFNVWLEDASWVQCSVI